MAENWRPLVRIIFSTTEGVVLPACAPHLAPTLLLTNYTRTTYSKYINDSRFTGAGLGHEDDWMVVVLTTSTTGGDFAGATSLVSKTFRCPFKVAAALARSSLEQIWKKKEKQINLSRQELLVSAQNFT
ncbi:hypothetical protein OIU77_003918 [Salix suchowensis]|uniref:Uncharacterized GPI-anchored protein At5g19230-like domain-containing protein n=1 Tax=Salix suchowensis TaxID=1278906 RepID=A0ABQ9ASN0_9ROSI|nr:hypothetical protein OIU77_003918 [Salix suchowensis]